MRELAPQETLRWMARLHRAFSVEGADVTDLSVFPGLLDGFAVDPERYTEVLTDTATLERTRADFDQARSYGVAGFPTLLSATATTWGRSPGDSPRGSSSSQR